MTSIKTDVLVIGGGPSGAMASALLAKNGIDVVVLEKENFPRYNVGESLIPHFWKFTDMMGASEEICEAGFIRKSGGAAYWNKTLRTMQFGPYGHDRPGLHVERDTFDQILLNKSKLLGAHIYEGCLATDVKIRSQDNIVLFTNADGEQKSIICNYLVDASGQHAVVSKLMGWREFDPNFRFQAFWGYFDRGDYLDIKGKATSFEKRFTVHPLSLVSSTGDWGWVWYLVLKEKISVGALVPKEQMAKFKGGGNDIDSRFLAYIASTPVVNNLLHGQLVSNVRTIRDYAYLPTKVVYNNCFLAGDAAAFADPINSEGVTMSLYGGMMAAWAINKAMQNKKRSAFYKQVYLKNLNQRYKVFQLLSYPKDTIAPQLLDSCLNVIKNQSEDETNLILAHLKVTNRANDFEELLKKLKIPAKKGWREIELNEKLVSNIN